jgi:hypothetical protein
MKCHNIAIHFIIVLALLSIPSLFDNVQAQTNSSSTNQMTSQQQQQKNQNTNLIAQALMKIDIVEIKDNLEKAKLAIVDGNLEDALKDVKDVETELSEIEPSPPTKLLNNIDKAINAIDKSNVDKSLDTLTNIQSIILKAENLILKNVVAKHQPQQMQQFTNLKTTINEEEYYTDLKEDYYDRMQQSNNMETNTNADYIPSMEDR